MKTTAIFFPFDLFGSAGAGAGAELLAEAFEEMLADNQRERIPTRARAYQNQIRVRQFRFDKADKYQDWRKTGREAVRRAWHKRDFLLWIAGNHLGVLPVYDELSVPSRPLRTDRTLVIQFDAHLDIYHLSDCTRSLSHGNFLLHAAGKLPPLINLGSRELLLRPEYVRRYYRAVYPAAELLMNMEAALEELKKASQTAERVFLDIDCDVFDAAYFPAVPQPVPFGLSLQQFLRLFDAVWSDNLVGVALSEFSPARDQQDRSLETLVWFLEYLLLKIYEK